MGVVPDTDEENSPLVLTALAIGPRRLFQTPDRSRRNTAPAKRGRGGSSSRSSSVRRGTKTRFKATFDMDLNRADTLLFNFIFSDDTPKE
ncbi:hypothetical protein PIB30_054877 [Stylosanthes scabra]|uniref:Uncharacterized protein n=1 Tax=Stylosanthes scabra TaxID=79078 RepID=A0ABU6XGP0_9FABA|nr:hypothetical protein [Stylosanthes scabra]